MLRLTQSKTATTLISFITMDFSECKVSPFASLALFRFHFLVPFLFSFRWYFFSSANISMSVMMGARKIRLPCWHEYIRVVHPFAKRFLRSGNFFGLKFLSVKSICSSVRMKAIECVFYPDQSQHIRATMNFVTLISCLLSECVDWIKDSKRYGVLSVRLLSILCKLMASDDLSLEKRFGINRNSIELLKLSRRHKDWTGWWCTRTKLSNGRPISAFIKLSEKVKADARGTFSIVVQVVNL